MKMAQGYVTDDGTFFESKNEAALHEAEIGLRRAVPEGVDPERVINLIRALAPELRRYLDAHYAAYPTTRDQQAQDEDGAEANASREAEAATNLGHISSAAEDLASLLKLPARGPVDVPDMGSGSRSEEVSKRRSEYGPRMRGVDASGIRRRKNMAAKQSAEAGLARSSGGPKDIQKREVE